MHMACQTVLRNSVGGSAVFSERQKPTTRWPKIAGLKIKPSRFKFQPSVSGHLLMWRFKTRTGNPQ